MKYLHNLLITILFLPLSCFAVEVDSLEVRLFYNDSGTFSEDILSTKDFHLWNTIIGEGSAAEPSDRFMIKVKFIGPVDEYLDNEVTLTVKVQETGEVIFTESFYGFLFNRAGTNYRAVMISDYTCQPLEVRIGKAKELINFRCGE